jgi:hypothetical protein
MSKQMASDLHVGDVVKLLKVQSSLVHDLPTDAQKRLYGLVGKVFVVQEISAHGFYWLGEEASFSVAREDIELVSRAHST